MERITAQKAKSSIKAQPPFIVARPPLECKGNYLQHRTGHHNRRCNSLQPVGATETDASTYEIFGRGTKAMRLLSMLSLCAVKYEPAKPYRQKFLLAEE